MDIAGEKEKRTCKKNVDRRNTGSHDNEKFGTRSVEKQGDGDSCYKTGRAGKHVGR
jgi:hypothetical protein